MVNIIEETYTIVYNLNKLHFGTKLEIPTSSKHYEESGYGHDSELLIISHLLHISYPTRSGCKWNEAKPFTCPSMLDILIFDNHPKGLLKLKFHTRSHHSLI